MKYLLQIPLFILCTICTGQSFQLITQYETDNTILNGISYQIDNRLINYQINTFYGFYKESKIIDDGHLDSYWDTDFYFQVKLGFKIIQKPIVVTVYPFYFDAKLRDGYRVPIGLEIKREIIPNLNIAISSEHTWFKKIYGQIKVSYTFLRFNKPAVHHNNLMN